MQLVERAVDISGLILSPEQSAVRSPGLHVSEVIRYIGRKIGRQKDNEYTEADLNQFAVFGRIWETHLAAATFKPPRYERPGEIEVDGIIGSPDAIDTVDWSVQEYKCWWRSSAKDITESRECFYQIKAYCYMLGMTRAHLCVAFVCGDWRPPKPVAKAWDIKFSPQELEENWRMLVNNGTEMQREQTA